MQTAVDAAITYRILKLLTTPWTSQNAYQLGIIDAHGMPLKKSSELRTAAEQNAYTLLHRLVFRLKRMLERMPMGSNQMVSYAAALALIKECHNRNVEPVPLESWFLECVDEDVDTTLVEEFLNSSKLKPFYQFVEDASAVAANNTSGIVGTGDDNQNVVPKKKSTILTRGINKCSSGTK